jgi:hypothetical protein
MKYKSLDSVAGWNLPQVKCQYPDKVAKIITHTSFQAPAYSLTDSIPLCCWINYVFAYNPLTKDRTTVSCFTFWVRPDDDFLKVETCSLI